jgi:polysaccharide deacetylase family protein (PEP-CTERM system associated)
MDGLVADSAGDATPTIGARRHVLSFDVEEYFQVEAAGRTVRPEDWPNFTSRLQAPIARILQVLADSGSSATFFVLGWVARRLPGLVRLIADAGHEIASHGVSHRMIGTLSREEFRDEAIESRKLLEDLASSAVTGFRAPTFSLVENTAWAIDVLAEAGYEYDSSVFPIRHDRYGVPAAPRWAHWAVGPGGAKLLEVPPLTVRLCTANLPVGGGGYLRLFPIHMVGMALRQAAKHGRIGVIYLHPWELDPDQPVLPMGAIGTWRHRVNLRRTDAKLRWLLSRHRFDSFRKRMPALRESALDRYAYGQSG